MAARDVSEAAARVGAWLGAHRLRTVCVSFLTGGAMVGAMPPYGFWPLIFLGYSTLYLLIAFAPSAMRAFALTWFFAFGFFLFGLSWIANALLVEGNSFRWVWPFAIAGLPIILALFPALAAGFFHRLFPDRRALSSFFALAVFLSVAEWLRGHAFTGFPWNLPAYAWADVLPIVQFVSIGGSYGLTYITILSGLVPGFVLAGDAGLRQRIGIAVLAGVLLASLFAYGFLRLSSSPSGGGDESLSVQIVQPNIPQADKWDSKKVWSNFEKTVSLSAPQPGTGRAETHIIVWPETAITQRQLADPQARARLKGVLDAHGDNTYLLAGVLRAEGNTEADASYFNSLAAFSSALTPLWVYDKSHLVPFGEYIPFQDILRFGPFVQFSGMSPGNGPMSVPVSERLISPVICYEIIFPGKVADPDGARPEAIVNVTNDAWYGDSAGPRQHFTMAVFRATEEGIPVFRAANTGISGIVDGYGRVVSMQPLNTSGALVHDSIPVRPISQTLFGALGEFFFWSLTLSTMALVFYSRRQM